MKINMSNSTRREFIKCTAYAASAVLCGGYASDSTAFEINSGIERDEENRIKLINAMVI